MKRVEIDDNDSAVEIVEKLAEGNPGAITVITKLVKTYPNKGLFNLLLADSLNIRGAQLWAAYKYWAEGDLEKLMNGFKMVDQNMLKVVNEICPEYVAG